MTLIVNQSNTTIEMAIDSPRKPFKTSYFSASRYVEPQTVDNNSALDEPAPAESAEPEVRAIEEEPPLEDEEDKFNYLSEAWWKGYWGWYAPQQGQVYADMKWRGLAKSYCKSYGKALHDLKNQELDDYIEGCIAGFNDANP
jgi:hypothetical protein